MYEKIKKHLIFIFTLSVIGLYSYGWSTMHEAKVLPVKAGTESVRVQVYSTDDTIKLDYLVPRAILTSLDEQGPCPKGSCTKIQVSAGNAITVSKEGIPLLPMIPIKILLPAGKAIDNITVNRSGEYEHSGEYFLNYGSKITPISCDTCDDTFLPDSNIYYSDNPFPEASYNNPVIQKKNGVSLAYINVYPITYYPLSGRVVSYSSISVTISLKEKTSEPYPVACYPDRVHPERLGIENPEALLTYTPEYCQQIKDNLPSTTTWGICDPAETYQYVVITNEILKNYIPSDPNDKKLDDLINWRSGPLGGQLATKVVTTDGTFGIYNYLLYDHGDHDFFTPAEDNAVKVRNFIREAVNNWETEYILLLGDVDLPSGVDMISYRYLWAFHGSGIGAEGANMASDLYFQCIDGPYNFQDNGINKDLWGQFKLDGDDGQGNHWVDLIADVFIGRAPTANGVEMSYFIAKTIKYETDVFNYDKTNPYYDYLEGALIVGEKLEPPPVGNPDFYGSTLMEYIRTGGFGTKGFDPSVMNISALYDDANFTWEKEDIRNCIDNKMYSIINHTGHGDWNWNMKMINTGILGLQNDEKFPFLYSDACVSGNFLRHSCAEYYIVEQQNGMWGGVLNSNVGLYTKKIQDKYGPSLFLNREFWDAYIYEGIFNAGAINADCHNDVASLIISEDDGVLFCTYETNLLADPYTPFLDPLPCERHIQNWYWNMYRDVLARKVITTGENVIFASGVSSADVTLISGKEIQLGPGLRIESGAKFKAYIDPALYKANCD